MIENLALPRFLSAEVDGADAISRAYPLNPHARASIEL
jgi:hypothetical protein